MVQDPHSESTTRNGKSVTQKTLRQLSYTFSLVFVYRHEFATERSPSDYRADSLSTEPPILSIELYYKVTRCRKITFRTIFFLLDLIKSVPVVQEKAFLALQAAIDATIL
ncbi:hypothetical protein PoB_001236600 [Plakobranchus ocellatus]|uniref:Uncharacterized protein n=1 Tax=Plakobranchus ocellatus TaxID=259542 RepID=A0AAV3YRB2_9GAST|nr:hypothetical protein PoB_001236600 [Plakobranchus ocellatus]